MRRRTKILGSLAVIAVALLGAWLMLTGRSAGPVVSLMIVTNAPNGSASFFTAFLTNNSTSDVMLDPPLVQEEEQQGRVVSSLGNIWFGKDGKQVFAMPAKTVATVSPQTDTEYRRLRLIVEYRYDKGGFRRVISNAVRKLPRKLLPRSLNG